MAPIRVTIFEDNRPYRESIEQLFGITPGIQVAGAFPDCSGLKEALESTRPDVILMDIDMPGINGIEATARVKALAPDTQVVMLTVSEEEERIFQALRNGATGYLLKKSGPDDLLEGVRSVYNGGSPISPAIARKVLQFFHGNLQTASGLSTSEQADATELSASLTPREREILEGLVDGLSYKMIASRYFISADTVKNHIQGIYRKLHVNSKGEAISLALRKGIVPTR
jgi:DNA-binding NarL/FixJ family response regulator